MRKPVSLFVGLRYLTARKGSRSSGFVSFVTAASVLGVALGVATLIVVLSVMNGFENELRDRLLGLTAHAAVIQDDGLADWPAVVAGMRSHPDVTGAAPFVELEAMLSGPNGLAGGLVTGVEPELEVDVSQIAGAMLTGGLADLTPGSNKIVLGRVLAQRLGAAVGDRIAVLVPQPRQGGRGMGSALRGFEVSGVFELGVLDHDSARAIVNLADAAALGGLNDRISGVRIETRDIFAAPASVREALSGVAGSRLLKVRDWTEENASYFRAIKIEKTMMTLLLSLIIGVAAFNIVATLVMVVTEKRSGIAILRTIGCSRRDIVAIFVLQGVVISWLGALVGIGLGIWVALNVETLAPQIEQLFGFQFMPADLYYLSALPSDLQTGDVVATGIIVLVIAALATFYPALRAAAVLPAEVLRYE
jgi:lipoprotein-releasing system permease protein